MSIGVLVGVGVGGSLECLLGVEGLCLFGCGLDFLCGWVWVDLFGGGVVVVGGD